MASERGDATRERLLAAAIEVFGRHGFEAGTRALAQQAGVNLAAIPYHFDSKQGLYLAAADHIARGIRTGIAPALAEAQAAEGPIDVDRARLLLQGILEAFARVMVHDESAGWARFVIREQMEPSEAFERLYGGAIGPVFETLARLVAVLYSGRSTDLNVRLQVPRLMGPVLMLRAARATILRETGWREIGEAEFAAIRDSIRSNVEALIRDGAEKT